MNKKFRSISWKILLTLISTISILILMVIIINIFVIQNLREDLIFDQIAENRDMNKSLNKDESMWIAKFVINLEFDEPLVTMDMYTKRIYLEKYNNSKVFLDITNILNKDRDLKKGSLRDKNSHHYYIVEWNNSKNIATVYISSVRVKKVFGHEILLLVLATIIVCYISSIYVAKIISKPIQHLELFSEEIANKNWKAEPPKHNNDEIGLLAEALNKMKFSLQDAEEREHYFLQSTSHDLKTPVMVIKGYAQSIIDNVNVDSDLSPAEIIVNETVQLERKINQLLQLNTIGHNNYTKNKDIVRIDRVLNSLVNRFKVIRPDIQWILDCSEVEINGDSESLVIALENIIDNQLRFAKTYIKITVINKDKTTIEISNNGPSFNVANPESLFDIYQKDKQGKFGLGLSIAKKAIEYHDGSISAKNSHPGVIFTIII